MNRTFLALILVGACAGPTTTPPSATGSGPAPKAAPVLATPKVPAGGFGLGRAATAEEIRAWDIDVDASGASLPPGSGTVAQGEDLYKVWCLTCHGALGEGGIGPKLVGVEPKTGFADDPAITKTIGNYWPHATTIFDYVRRAMPQMAPGSLTDDQVYALTAYLLHKNEIVDATFVADKASITGVKMPTRVTFIRDDREQDNKFR